MKYCLLLIGIFSTAVATAQFNMNFYTQAGGNYTTPIRITRTTGIETSNGGFGGQIGIGTEYHTAFGYFVYLGANLIKESYTKDSLSSYIPDTVSHFIYNPIFLNFPLGVGWQLPITKKLSLKAYGGLNVQVGVSGTVRRRISYYAYDSTQQQNVLIHTTRNEHDLRYGRLSRKRYTYDYANSNWGINIGTGINLNNSFELNVFYYHGFTNILPNRDFAVEVNKLSYFEVNARMYFPNHYFGKKKEKRSPY